MSQPKRWNTERFIESRSISRRKYHRCLRCGRNFLCPDQEICKAGVDVSPHLFIKGKLMSHCPDVPSWNFIREYAKTEEECKTGGVPLYEHEFFEIEAL